MLSQDGSEEGKDAVFDIHLKGRLISKIYGIAKQAAEKYLARWSATSAATAGSENKPVIASGEPLRHPKSSATSTSSRRL
jgi:hypothetical protein